MKFSANLGFLWNDRPLPEAFAPPRWPVLTPWNAIGPTMSLPKR